MRRHGPPDIVPTADEATLRKIYGEDADEIIAFGRFLKLPRDEQGRVLCPQHWHDYATNKISGKEAVALDDKVKGGNDELQGGNQEEAHPSDRGER